MSKWDAGGVYLQKWAYTECEDRLKYIACCGSLYIYNVLTKGTQHKLMVKSI